MCRFWFKWLKLLFLWWKIGGLPLPDHELFTAHEDVVQGAVSILKVQDSLISLPFVISIWLILATVTIASSIQDSLIILRFVILLLVQTMATTATLSRLLPQVCTLVQTLKVTYPFGAGCCSWGRREWLGSIGWSTGRKSTSEIYPSDFVILR
jgi:hypothetical protein